MTAKRKAELQRKLTLASVPRPPKDLASRIKADIPNYLSVEPERERFARSIGSNFRIAASILVLVSVAALMFMLVPENREAPSMAIAPVTAKEAPRQVAESAPTAAADQLQVEITQPAPASVAPPPAAAVPRPKPSTMAYNDEAPRRMRAAETDAESNTVSRRDAAFEGVEQRGERGVAGGVVGGVAGGVAGGTIAAVAPAPPPSAAPAAPAEEKETTVVTAEAPMLRAATIVPEAYAADLSFTPRAVFGLSLDPDVFRRIKATIESGGRPAPSAVNVEALVNYFAGPPARKVRRGVRLEVEGSPAPVDANGHRGILRFTIDTAALETAQGGSVPPIATDARLEIEVNGEAVAKFEPIGDRTPTTESALLHNVSVTGLYELDLRTPLEERQTIATIHLHYRSIADGKKHTITRILRGADFAKQWTRASRRHRLASLGALWGESLRDRREGTDVARRAEELASQAPNDTRARELAEAAVASSGGLH